MRFILVSLLFLATSFKQEVVMICVSPTAHSYHNSYCRGLNACTHPIKKILLSDALRLKKDPCDFCYKGGGAKVKSVPSGSGSGQCLGITQKGTQCSRKGKANGYCYQHGGN